MSSGAVPIRPVNQSVETPSPGLPSNPLRAEPIESAAGPALEKGGSDLFDFWAKQQQAQNAADLGNAHLDFQSRIGQLKNQLLNSGMNAQDMSQNFETSSKELINAYTSGDSAPYPNIRRQLGVTLPAELAPHLADFPYEATQRVARDLDFRAKTQVTNFAQQVGPNYTIGGTADAPVFQDNADGAALTDHAHAMINGMYPPTARKTENDLYNAQFDHQKAVQRGMLVAMDHPSLVDSYIKQNPTLTPEEQMTMTNRATAAIDLPMRQINASNEATRAQLLQKFDGQVQNGNLDTAALDHAARFKLITPEDYERYSGIPLAQPSDPGAVSAAQAAIQGARSPEELDDLRASIAGNQLIRGKDSVSLPIQIENAKRQMNTTGGKAKITSEETIRDAYPRPGMRSDPNAVINEKLDPGAREAAARAAVAEFKAATLNETDPVKINAAAAAAIAHHPNPLTTKTPPKSGPPPGAPARLPGESWEAYGKRAKGAMGIH